MKEENLDINQCCFAYFSSHFQLSQNFRSFLLSFNDCQKTFEKHLFIGLSFPRKVLFFYPFSKSGKMIIRWSILGGLKLNCIKTFQNISSWQIYEFMKGRRIKKFQAINYLLSPPFFKRSKCMTNTTSKTHDNFQITLFNI